MPHRSARRRTAMLLGILAMAASCAGHSREVPPLDAAMRGRLQQLLVSMVPEQPVRQFGPLPKSGHTGRNAAAAAGGIFMGMTVEGAKGEPAGLLVGAALGLLLAPFAAVVGAVATEEKVQPVTIAANQQLVKAVTEGGWTRQLEQAVGAKLGSLGAARANDLDAATAGHLGLRLEGPWLVLDGDDGIPAVTVHAELIVDETCVLDRRWRWNGAVADFVDLGVSGAKAYKAQLSAGISQLGDAIVSDLLLDQEPRKVAYKGKAGVAAQALPLIVTDPDGHQGQIGSWDTTPAERGWRPRCEGLLALRRAPSREIATPIDSVQERFPLGLR